jgi:hypothetical protein
LEVQQQTQPGALYLFTSYLPTTQTQQQYLYRLSLFFNYLQLPGNNIEEQAANFVKKARTDPQWSLNCIINYVNSYRQKVVNKEISSTSLSNYCIPLKSFYEANDLQLN